MNIKKISIYIFLIIILGTICSGKELYVDINNPSCNDTYTRTQNNFTNPWCSTSGYTSSFGGIHKLIGGDYVYYLEGEYNNPSSRYIYSNNSVSGNITIQSYNSEEVNITSYATDYASIPNALWTQISSNPNTWTTTYGSLSTSYPIVQYENGTKFMTMRCYNESGCAYNTWLVETSRNIDMSWGDDASNNITIRLKDLSANPNNIKLYISEEQGIIQLRSHGINSSLIKFKNLNFNKYRFSLYIYNSSNILIDNCNFDGGYNAIWVRGHSSLAYKVNNIEIKNSNFNGRWNWDSEWYNEDIKEAYEETEGIYTLDITNRVYIHNNNFTNWAGGVLLDTGSQFENNGSQVSYNRFINGSGSQIEIEKYCYNSTWNNNIITNSQLGISLGPANGHIDSPCKINYNIVDLKDKILYNQSTNYSSYAIKVYDAGTGLYVSYFNVTQNTFIGGGKSFYGLATTIRDHRNSSWTNNIFLSSSQSTIEKTGEPIDNVFYDYNLYYRYGGGNTFYKWSNDSSTNLYTTLALAKAGGDWDGLWDINSLNEDPLLTSSYEPEYTSPVCTASDSGSYIGALPCLSAPTPTPTIAESKIEEIIEGIGSGFALGAIAALVVAAMLIVAVLNNNSNIGIVEAMSMIVVGLIVLLIGMFIIAIIGNKFI